MAVLLALGAGLSFGTADFVGGLAAKRSPAATVTVLSQLAGFAVLLAVLGFLPGAPSPAALGLGAFAGIAGCLGLVAYLRALAAGPMGLVAPITSVAAVAVPVGAGLLAGARRSGVATAGRVLGLVAIGIALVGFIVVLFLANVYLYRSSSGELRSSIDQILSLRGTPTETMP